MKIREKTKLSIIKNEKIIVEKYTNLADISNEEIIIDGYKIKGEFLKIKRMDDYMIEIVGKINQIVISY